MLGEAFLTFVIKKGKDITTVAHLGRHIPAELRTALVVSGRECDVEGCDNRGISRSTTHTPSAKAASPRGRTFAG